MRKKSLLLFIVAPIFLFVLLTQLADAQAARPSQASDEAAAGSETEVAQSEPLTQPLSIRIRQSMPLTIALGLMRPITAPLPVVASATPTEGLGLEEAPDVTGTLPLTDIIFVTSGLTETPTIFAGVGVTLEIDLQLVVTQTLTSTVPANLVIRLGEMPTMTVPISITFGPASDALVTLTTVAPAPEITTTVEPTETATLTETSEITATETPTPTLSIDDLAAVIATVPFTANVRSEPVIGENIVRQASPGSTVEVVARNEAGDWLLLLDGNWIAASVVTNPPTNVPAATQELIDALRAAPPAVEPAPTITPTTTITPAEVVTPTTPITPTEAITPTTPVTPLVETPTAVVSPTVTVNANLRSGPGTEFPVIGGTITGQTINITARNEDATWFLLDNGGWVSAGLVANAPISSTVPVFNPAAPAATPTPEAPAAPLLPTPTPRAQTAPAGLSVEENLYLIEVESVSGKYDRAIASIDRLVTSAGGDETLLQDAQWTTEMNTAIALLRSASDDVGELTPTDRLAAAHDALVTAAEQFDRAADLLEAAVSQASVAQLDQALAQIGFADTTLDEAVGAFNTLRP
jgi:hypothetical protein